MLLHYAGVCQRLGSRLGSTSSSTLRRHVYQVLEGPFPHNFNATSKSKREESRVAERRRRQQSKVSITCLAFFNRGSKNAAGVRIVVLPARRTASSFSLPSVRLPDQTGKPSWLGPQGIARQRGRERAEHKIIPRDRSRDLPQTPPHGMTERSRVWVLIWALAGPWPQKPSRWRGCAAVSRWRFLGAKLSACSLWEWRCWRF